MMEFKVDDMSCGHCAGVITKTVQGLDAQARVEVDLAQKKVTIESNQERAVIAAALEEAGYPTA